MVRWLTSHSYSSDQKYFCISLFSLGDLSEGKHLFPFRTEKLSLHEPMILHCGESRLSPRLSNEKTRNRCAVQKIVYNLLYCTPVFYFGEREKRVSIYSCSPPERRRNKAIPFLHEVHELAIFDKPPFLHSKTARDSLFTLFLL